MALEEAAEAVEAVTAEAVMAVVTAAEVTAEAVMAVVTVEAVMAVVTVEAVMAVVTAEAVMAVVTVAVVTLNLHQNMLTNLLEQKVGKIEVTENLPKILNSRMEEVEEKEASRVILKCLRKVTSSPSLEVLMTF